MIVGLTIGSMLIMGLLIPNIDNITDPLKEKHNNSFGSYAVLTGSETAVITIDESNNYYYNGELYTIPNKELVLMCDHAILSYASNTHELLIVDNDGTYHEITTLPMELTINDGDLTLVYGPANTTLATKYSDWCGIAAPEGDYRVLSVAGSAKTMYLNNVDQIYGASQYKTGQTIVSYHGNQIIDARGVFENLSINYEPEVVIDSPKPIIKLSASTNSDITTIYYTGEYNGNDVKGIAGSILVPEQVIGETTQNYQYIVMFGVIPLLCIVGLVVYAASMVRSRN